jgi:hypothetical protein
VKGAESGQCSVDNDENRRGGREIVIGCCRKGKLLNMCARQKKRAEQGGPPRADLLIKEARNGISSVDQLNPQLLFERLLVAMGQTPVP